MEDEKVMWKHFKAFMLVMHLVVSREKPYERAPLENVCIQFFKLDGSSYGSHVHGNENLKEELVGKRRQMAEMKED